MISKSFLIAFMMLVNTYPYTSAEENNDSFTVFCTGNHDSTGTCIDTNADDDSNSLNCTMVPGNIMMQKRVKRSNRMYLNYSDIGPSGILLQKKQIHFN